MSSDTAIIVPLEIDGLEISCVVHSYQFPQHCASPLDYLRQLVSAASPQSPLRKFPSVLEGCSQIAMLDLSTMHSEITDVSATGFRVRARSPSGRDPVPLCDPVPPPPSNLGDITAFVVRHPIPHNQDSYVHGLVGVLPWSLLTPDCFVTDGAAHRIRVNMKALVRNVSFSDERIDTLMRTFAPHSPLFDLASQAGGGGGGDDDDAYRCRLPIAAVFSFALNWHMVKCAKPDELDRVLNARSLRFFGERAPRQALFGCKAGFLAIRHTVAQLTHRGAHAFLVSQLVGAVDTLLSAAVSNDFARLGLLRSSLEPLANLICAIDEPAAGIADCIRARPAALEIHTLGALLRNGVIDMQEALWLEQSATTEATVLARAIHMVSFETSEVARCEAIAGSAGSAGSAATSASAPDIHSASNLRRAKERLAKARALEETSRTALDAMLDISDEPALRRPDTLCVSFEFDSRISTLIRERHSFIEFVAIKHGRVFVSNVDVHRRLCVELFRFYVTSMMGVDVDADPDASAPAVGVDWQAEFVRAIPAVGAVYADDRSTRFDDCSVGGWLQHQIAPRLDARQMASFLAHKTAHVDLPNGFNAAHRYSLCKSQSTAKSFDPALHIDPGAYRLALINASHTPRCRRDHIDIEYDSSDRQGSEERSRAKIAARQSATKDTDLLAALKENARGGCYGSSQELEAIEDIARNLHENGVVPLCVSQFTQRVVTRSDHFKEPERRMYYRLLSSLNLPELDHRAVVRHMLSITRNTETLAKQFRDVDNFERLADRAHEKAASFKQRIVLENSMSEMSHDDALASTTSAPGCWTMTTKMDRIGCPFAQQSGARIKALLVGAGVPPESAERIMSGTESEPSTAFKMCRKHLRYTIAGDDNGRLPDDVFRLMNSTRHPRDFVHASALALLYKAEKQNNN